MKRKIRGVKRSTFALDYDLYRVKVPIPDQPNQFLSVIDMHPEHVEETIVFQHGYAGVSESWEHQINHFSQNYRVVVPDLRGHGQSDAPFSQYTMDELIADLQAIVVTLNLPEKFILVGHSFGGSVCIEYANRHPNRIDKLALIATAGEYPLPRWTGILSRIPSGMVRPFWKYRPRWDAEIHVMKRMLLNNLRKWQGWSMMRDIRNPTLIITGERDNYFPRFVFEDVGKVIPTAEVIDVGSAKHKVQLERYQAVNRALDRFFSGRGKSWRDDTPTNDLFKRRPWIAHYPENTPATIPLPHQPLHRFLESAADWRPRQTATLFYGDRMTYDQINRKANQFARALLGRGVMRGDRVMIVLPNMPQFIVAYYGILKMGGVVVLPNPDANLDSIMFQMQESGSKVIVLLDSYASLAKELHDQTSVEQVVTVDIDASVAKSLQTRILETKTISHDLIMTRRLAIRFDDFIEDEAESNLDIDVDAFALANITYTSGTTDAPKGACLTHRNLVANALQTRHWFPEMTYAGERFLSVVPFLHSYGMTAAMNVPITMAATIIILSSFEIQQILDHIRHYRPTIFPGIPPMYTAINQAPNVRDFGLSSIKACISGAAPLPVEVQEAFEKLTRGRLVEGYGLTEASPVTHANPLYGIRKVGSIGIPLPNTDARIVDLITGEDVEPGKIGELLVKGPQVMTGYWNAKASESVDHLTESSLKDGWLYTGDVAVMDADGYFKIIARKRETIMTGNYSVYPRDVEEVLYENNKVLEAAVVGIGAETADQKIKAFVVPRPGTRLSKEDLIELCRNRLEEYAVPYDIEFRTELPRSFVGKVLRRMLVEPITETTPDD